jgi:U3 small nucleolar RNA-associated protein 10
LRGRASDLLGGLHGLLVCSVAEFNVEALLRCVLPYHETNLFVRVVQLLRLRLAPPADPTGHVRSPHVRASPGPLASAEQHPRWEFLRAVQKTGSPLSRQTLITRCVHDASLLDYIASSVRRAAPMSVVVNPRC